MTQNFYDLLGVDEDASKEEIRDAFRDMVQKYHPDRNDDARATAQFTVIKEAYDTLKDPVERKAYDRLGHTTYVSKRLDGLPDPDSWPSEDDDQEESSSSSQTASTGASGRSSTSSRSSTSTTSSSRSTTSTSSSGGSGSSGRSTSRSRGSTGRSSGSSSSSRTSGTSSNSGRSASNASSTGSTSASSARGSEASAGSTVGDGGTTQSAGATAGASGGAGSASSGAAESGVAATLLDNSTVNWFRTALPGWPLIFLSIAIYIGGVAGWGAVHRSGLTAFLADLRAAGADVEALRAVVRTGRYGVVTAWEHVSAAVMVVPTATTGLLFAVGIVLMPLVFLVNIRWTRQYPGWKPTYLYVPPALAPAAVLGATAAVGPLPLSAELLGYAVLPALSITTLIARGFVWPRVKGYLG